MIKFTKKPSLDMLKDAIRKELEECSFSTDYGNVEFSINCSVNDTTNYIHSFYMPFEDFNRFLFKLWKKGLAKWEKFNNVKNKSYDDIVKYVIKLYGLEDKDSQSIQNAVYNYLDFEIIRDDDIPEEALSSLALQIMKTIDCEEDFKFVEISK